jgi:hypothetical protein
MFYMTNSTSGSPSPEYAFAFGAPGDTAITGDWDVDFKDSIGVVRSGVWYLTNAITGSPAVNYAFAFGGAGDTPVNGTWTAGAAPAVPSSQQSSPQTRAGNPQAPDLALIRAPVYMPCAQTMSCVAPPDAWYGAKSLADPRNQTLRGWTGPIAPATTGPTTAPIAPLQDAPAPVITKPAPATPPVEGPFSGPAGGLASTGLVAPSTDRKR